MADDGIVALKLFRPGICVDMRQLSMDINIRERPALASLSPFFNTVSPDRGQSTEYRRQDRGDDTDIGAAGSSCKGNSRRYCATTHLVGD